MKLILILKSSNEFVHALGFDACKMEQSLFLVFNMFDAFLILKGCLFDGLS